MRSKVCCRVTSILVVVSMVTVGCRSMLPCETHTASVGLSVSATEPNVDDIVEVSVTLNNQGCVALGLPQFRLYVQSDEPEAVLTPDDPEPVVHYLAVAPAETDAVEFELQAVTAGEATIRASASFEVHLDDAAYWGQAGSGPLAITVVP